MAPKALFKKCSKCGTKRIHSDEHNLCFLCLGEAHNVSLSVIGQSFTPKTSSDTASRVKGALREMDLSFSFLAKHTTASELMALTPHPPIPTAAPHSGLPSIHSVALVPTVWTTPLPLKRPASVSPEDPSPGSSKKASCHSEPPPKKQGRSKHMLSLPCTPSPYLASCAHSFSEYDDNQPDIPPGQSIQRECRPLLSGQPTDQQQCSYMSSLHLSQWEKHCPQLPEDQDPASDNAVNSPYHESEKSSIASCSSPESASDLSPDDIVGDPTPVSPTKDVCLYAEQMLRMAKALKIDVATSNNRPNDKILSCLYPETPSTVAFPILEGLSDLTKPIWERPSSVQATPRNIENLYRVKQDSAEYLSKHPVPSSLIIEDMQAWCHPGQHVSPTDRESRRLDTLGRKLYSSSALNFRIADYQTIMGRYQLYLWESLSKYLDELPGESKRLAKQIQSEAVKLSKKEVRAGKHSADMSARSMASAIVLRRHSWLRNTDLPIAIRSRVENLPFEGSTLFAQSTDDFLSMMKKKQQTAGSLSVYPSAPTHGHQFSQRQPRIVTPFCRGQQSCQQSCLCPQCLFHKDNSRPQPTQHNLQRDQGQQPQEF